MPTLHVVFGPPGAGKSTYARDLARREAAVVFSIDDWMAQLFTPDMPDQPDLDWVMERVGRCESVIWPLAANAMGAGISAVLDLGLMRRDDRARVAEIAQAVALPMQRHLVTAAPDVRRRRILERDRFQEQRFNLQLTPEMFAFMEGVYEAPDREELALCVISESD